MSLITIEKLTLTDLESMLNLAQKINPHKTFDELSKIQQAMFTYDHYHCFGIFKNSVLVGLSSGWVTVRFYCGKQLEVDNLMVEPNLQSNGYGHILIKYLENWAKDNGCLTVELNTYVFNERSHKFYFNQGYKIIGYHFQKNVS